MESKEGVTGSSAMLVLLRSILARVYRYAVLHSGAKPKVKQPALHKSSQRLSFALHRREEAQTAVGNAMHIQPRNTGEACLGAGGYGGLVSHMHALNARLSGQSVSTHLRSPVVPELRLPSEVQVALDPSIDQPLF